MSGTLLSTDWYRAAALRPRLRAHVVIRPQRYRGERWFLLQDPASQRLHRLNPPSYFVVGLMDGTRTVAEIWDAVLAKFGDDGPTQPEMIRLLSELHAADLLQSDVVPEAGELQQRSDRTERQKWLQRLLNPMALRFPLFDPDQLLTALLPLARAMFSRWGGIVWLVTVGSALLVAASHWRELTRDVTDHLLAPDNLLVLALVFAVVKALHEMGHGLAVKRWGGEVHELGIMLLVLMPSPYVDATAAWAFRDRFKRAIVGAAGMVVELFLASLALFAWVALEPGITRAIAYNIMVVASISTVLFNGNPLLRFDGYYILADLVEIPNLGRRANQLIAELCQRHLLGKRDAERVGETRSERAWLGTYAVTSFCYRTLITISIVTFIAGRFFTFGMLLAIWSVAAMVVMPLVKLGNFVLKSPSLHRQRTRAIQVTAAGLTLVFLILFVVPMPFFTRTEGIIWLPEQAHLRAGTAGFVSGILATPGQEVAAGTALLTFDDPGLSSRVQVLEAQKAQLEARYRAERLEDLVKAQVTLADLAATLKQLERERERAAHLTLTAPVPGRLVLLQANDLQGRYVKQGQVLGYVIGESTPRVRVAVSQADADLVRKHTREVLIRVVSRVSDEYMARLLREMPAASADLPSAALSRRGGGSIANAPDDRQGETALQPMFQFELDVPEGLAISHFGQRVFVRFDHGFAPLWSQAYRHIKLAFLKLLHD